MTVATPRPTPRAARRLRAGRWASARRARRGTIRTERASVSRSLNLPPPSAEGAARSPLALRTLQPAPRGPQAPPRAPRRGHLPDVPPRGGGPGLRSREAGGGEDAAPRAGGRVGPEVPRGRGAERGETRRGARLPRSRGGQGEGARGAGARRGTDSGALDPESPQPRDDVLRFEPGPAEDRLRREDAVLEEEHAVRGGGRSEGR